MWALQLNMMRNRCENLDVVAISETKEGLEAFLAREKVESYTDEGPGGWGNETRMVNFRKAYRKGGPLEWFNPPVNHEENFINMGTREEAMERSGRSYDIFVGRFPKV